MSRIGRLLAAVLALGLGAGITISSACVTAPRASAATSCDPDNTVAGDLNSDGIADVVVGVPSYDNERGAVDVLFSNGQRRLLRATDLGLPSSPGDRFGEAVTLGDVNADGCADLAIGAPGRTSGKGSVSLVKGSHNNALTLMNSFTGSAAHGSFGAQVVLLTPQELTPLGWVRTGQQLVVSAPTADDGTKWEAGQVVVLPLTRTGALASARVTLTQNSPGIPGTSANGDRFGTALAGQGRTIVIGTPNKAVGTRKGAGSVTLLSSTAAAPTSFKGVAVTQNSAGVPGTAETGDQFGAAVAVRDNHVLVGVPGESLGSARYTGMVHVLHFNPVSRSYRSLRAVHQNSAGIPGSTRTGDYFGSAVALGVNTVDQLTAVVGVPGKAVGTALGAGAVTMFRANRAGGKAVTIQQGKGGVPGKAEAADHFGATVGILGGDLAAGEAMRDGIVVGAPGEDVGKAVDAGSVVYSRSLTSWSARVLDAASATPPADARYGEALASVAAP
ncbi:MAG: FG-GAP repeat protein [Micropruina sp.]|uniref:FG-GAP repeat domain-containing protein n=1 Tax=Micropruina sp. TaxID=2737536 RepID=UPI0039E5A4FF